MQFLNGQRNLSGMDMRRLDLSEIDFRGASLYRARLGSAVLSHAILTGSGTNLKYASFDDAVMVNADCSAAAMQFASLKKADVSNSSFEGTQMDNAILVQVVAVHATFAKAQMKDVDLTGEMYQTPALVLRCLKTAWARV